MSTTESFAPYLRQALRLAKKGRYRTSPNPMVGAVVVRGREVIGTGYHRQVGGAHAEAEALLEAGEKARGATLFVTLEPCNHHGRTPPCSEAILEAGVKQVVACHRDPNSGVNGCGFERLRTAGIEVTSGMFSDEAVRLNWRYLISKTEHRPAVTVKWAMSLDGKIATAKRDSQWISSPAGRHWGLDQRERNDAILVGIGTVLDDDPSLDRRLSRAKRPNLRVVLDRRLRTPIDSKMFDIPGEVLIYTEELAGSAQRLQDRGAIVVHLDQVTPSDVLIDLHRRGVQSLLIEGGSTVAAAFIQAGLYDRVAVDCAPLLIGGSGALGPLGGAGFDPLSAAPRLDRLRCERRGDDVILSGFRKRCLQDLSAKLAG